MSLIPEVSKSICWYEISMYKLLIQCCGAEIIYGIFGSGSDFVHNFGSSYIYCHLKLFYSITVVLYYCNRGRNELSYVLASSKRTAENVYLNLFSAPAPGPQIISAPPAPALQHRNNHNIILLFSNFYNILFFNWLLLMRKSCNYEVIFFLSEYC